MKILYISRAELPSTTSNSLSIIRMCQALADTNHEVTLAFVAPNAVEDKDILAYYGIPGGFKLAANRSLWSGRLKKLSAGFRRYFVNPLVHRYQVKRARPHLVYSRLTLPELMLLPRQTPLLYEMHSPNYLGGPLPSKLLFLWVLKSFSRVKFVVTTAALQSLVREAFPLFETVRAPLSADSPLTQIEQSETPNPLRSCSNPKCLGSAGYTGFVDTSDLRGIGTILELAERLPNICFHIVGGGNDESVEFWKAMAERKGISRNTHFYGRQNPSAVPRFLIHLDVLLSPLRFRTTKVAPFGRNASPLKIPQYLAYGKAIVASDVPAHREYLTDELNAYLVGEQDYDSWCRRLMLLMANPDKRQMMGRANELLFHSRFTHRQRVESILEGF